jgi:hypothetical protein
VRRTQNRKITLTISTPSGEYTNAFKNNQQLRDVVKGTLKKLKLASEGSWILEHNGSVLNQTQSIVRAGLKDSDVLTLNPQEAGGGSGRQ